jgi:GT2 family glycosyltransferase
VTALDASVVVSTFNRAEALVETLAALARQDAPLNSYEVIVVDDGSTDNTWAKLEAISTPYPLRTVRHNGNRGVSAGRNSGIRLAQGGTLIFVSDDVLVPPSFVRQHVETLERMPGYWVVGAFRQRDSTIATPFGRYLEDLERSFESGRSANEIAPGLWEMTWPTARNLSLPRADLDRIGLFDERFRTTCEDQDLAQRARDAGIRFVYSTEIDCIHNDQAADLERYCSFQERGARDTVALCAKAPELHGEAPIVQVNGPISPEDGPRLALKKLCKLVLARSLPTILLYDAIRAGERLRLPEPILRRAYRLAISLAIFRGWRAELADDPSARARLGPPSRRPQQFQASRP